MKEIEKFVNFVKKTEGGEDYEDWVELLDRMIPNWRELVKDPDSWQLIDEVKPKKYEFHYYKALVRVAGFGLANHWFFSKDEGRMKVARSWLEDQVDECTITSEGWKALGEDVKIYLIDYLFDSYPGEPFESYKHLRLDESYKHLRLEKFLLPVIGDYFPSREILYLRRVAEEAGDDKFLKVINDMIKERKEAVRKISFLSPVSKFLYEPTREERKLIASVMKEFKKNGYGLSPLPEIYLSLEIPPIFVTYPELEEELEEDKEERRSQTNLQNKWEEKEGRQETISIEEVLGCYLPDSKIIILYQRGIAWCSRTYNFNEELLRGVVLVHEIGHWITHLLPKPNSPLWPTELYKLSSEDVKEGWAQLITWWAVNKVRGGIEKVFEELNARQPSPYKVYEKFKGIPIKSVIDSLERLRKLRFPAGIDDWKI